MAHLGVLRLKEGRCSGDGNAGLHIAGSKMDVDRQNLLYLHNDVVDDIPFESRRLSLKRVLAGKQILHLRATILPKRTPRSTFLGLEEDPT